MASNEFLGKFREMMLKKKKEEQARFGENDLIPKSIDNDEKGKNVTSDNSTMSTSLDTANNAISTENNKVKSRERSSIFNLAKRFDRQSSNDDVIDINNTAENLNEKENIKINSKDQMSYFSDDFRKSPECKKRSSTNKNILKNSLKNKKDKINEEITLNDPHTISSDTDLTLTNSTSLNKPDVVAVTPNNSLSTNIVTSLPRRSVLQMVKMIEEKKKLNQRNSVNENFNKNMNDIAKYLQSLKQTNDERIDSEEFLSRNSEKLKQSGINENDLPLVQELVVFFEKSSKDKQANQTVNPKRNTISSTSSSISRFLINVPTIAEEKDEDISQGDSIMKNSLINNERIKKETIGKNKDIYIKDKKASSDSGSEASDQSFDKRMFENQIIGDCEENFNSNSNNNGIDSNRHELTISKNKMNEISMQPQSFIIKNDIINIDKYIKYTADLSYSNVIDFSYYGEKTNKYSSYIVSNLTRDGDINFKLDECGSEFLKKKTNMSSFSFLVNSFSINSNNLLLRLKKLKISSEIQLELKPIEKKLTICSLPDINYYYKNEKKFNIVQVNDFQLKRINHIYKYDSIITDRNEHEIKCAFSKKEIKPKSFLEDQIEQEEIISRVRAIQPPSTVENTNTKPKSLCDKSQIENFITNTLQSSRYQKNIINCLDSISISQYNVNSNIPLDPVFFDVLCINCYECVKYNEIDLHSNSCLLEDNKESYEEEKEDYNSRIYKLHEAIVSKKNDIDKTNDKMLISLYSELTSLIYEILMNNNSIEELDKSISSVNEILNHKLNHVSSNYKFSLLIFGQRLSQLVYTKLTDMEKILMCVKLSDHSSDSEKENIEIYEDDPENDKQIQLLKMELANLERQTLTAKVEIEQWRKESKLLENLLRKPNINSEILSDINSDVFSRRDESVFFFN